MGRQVFPVSRRWVVLGLLAVLVAMTVDALVRGRGEFDYDLIRTLREVDFAGVEPVMGFVSWLTGSTPTIALWALALVVALALRRWLEAAVLATFPFVGAFNWVFRELVGRERPDPAVIGGDLANETFGNDWQSFPSGHVVGAILLFGFVFVLAGGIRQVWLRWSVRAVCVGVVALAGPSRAWTGHHWVGDVVSGYALGLLALTGIVAAYVSMRPYFGRLSLVRAAPVPHDDSLPHAHALTSTLLFREGIVYKIYNPGFVPRFIYWLSFQAPFAYTYNRRALEAAVLRRNLAGKLTEYWYGSNRVAPALGVTEVDGRLALMGRFTVGEEPADHGPARAFLFELADHFDQSGLPTWQVDPRQPRSLGNLLETAPGEYLVIDLESGMVSPMASPRAWWRALRRSRVPIYDDVYFDVTREYVAAHRESMAGRMGGAWLAELEALVDEAERASDEWHAMEPRAWSAAARFFWSGFGVRPFARWLQAKRMRGLEVADSWMDASITRWEDEGRYTPEEAARTRLQLLDPGVQQVLPHFGVHLLIGVALRFPIGSVARVLYVSGNMLMAVVLFMLRRRDRHQLRQSLSIHSPLVLLIAAMPGVGTFSYLASGPVLRNHQLWRVAIDTVGVKLPFQVYRRTGMRRIIAKPVRQAPVEAEGTS